MLWFDTAEGQRGNVFLVSGSRRTEHIALANLKEALATPLLLLNELTRDPTSSACSGLALQACRLVMKWAEQEGCPATRLAFTQAAAFLDPANPPLALEVGRLARELGEHARAESWFRHAIHLSRAADRETYVWAYVGLGTLYIRAGNLPAATHVMTRALRAAERNRLRPLAGVAHHHMFHLTTESGRITDAYRHVRAAFDYYDAGHPRLPYLFSDVGRFWLHIGQAHRAIPLFEFAIAHLLQKANERAMVSGNSTWAAAECADLDRYESFRSRTLTLINAADHRAHLEDAWFGIAYADLLLGQWERALTSAANAASVASAVGNADTRFRAEELKDAARFRRSLPRAEANEDGVESRQADLLAGAFLAMQT